MSRILSDRAEKTDQVVVLSSSLESPSHIPPGTFRLGLLTICISIAVFFGALVVAYYWRSVRPPFWDPIHLPETLWISTALILASSVPFEWARRVFRKGERRLASKLLLVTASLGVAFLAAQVSAWRQLVQEGAYLSGNPHSSFFYIFTGLHAAHLVGGLVALFILLLGRPKRRELFDVCCYYWHFLGLLWIALFIVIRTR
jgi:cytochrome c oxidase subunit III